MNRENFNALFVSAVNKFRELAPKDTGHLAFNAIKGRWINDNHFKIWIDKSVLVNEPNIRGEIAGYYYAKTINDNPNWRTYNYVEKNARAIAEYIAQRIGGVIK